MFTGRVLRRYFEENQRARGFYRLLGFTAQSIVKDVAINTPLAPGAFDLTP